MYSSGFKWLLDPLRPTCVTGIHSLIMHAGVSPPASNCRHPQSLDSNIHLSNGQRRAVKHEAPVLVTAVIGFLHAGPKTVRR